MNKEEILARSRKENETSDERTNLIQKEAAQFAIGVLIIFSAVMVIFAPIDGVGQSVVKLLISVTCFSNFAYQIVKNRTKMVVFFTVAFALGLIVTGYGFLNELGIL